MLCNEPNGVFRQFSTAGVRRIQYAPSFEMTARTVRHRITASPMIDQFSTYERSSRTASSQGEVGSSGHLPQTGQSGFTSIRRATRPS